MTDSSANPRNYGERPLHEDDPLMELSRIMDFGTPADDNVAWNERRPTQFGNTHFEDRTDPGFDPSLDLERELLGDFSDYSQPVDQSQFAAASAHDDSHQSGAPLIHEEELASALEDELDLQMDEDELAPEVETPSFETLEFEEADRTEPVPQFDYNDYSAARDSNADDFTASSSVYGRRETIEPLHIDQTDYDPTIYQPAIEPHEEAYQSARHHDWNVQAVEPEQPSYAAVTAPVSLEDELENLLFGDEPQPASPELASHDETYFSHVAPAESPDAHHDVAPVQNSGYQDAPELDDFHFDDLQLDEPAHDSAAEAVAQSEQGYGYTPQATPSAYPYYTRSNFAPGVAGQDAVARAPQADYAPAVESASSVDNDDDFSFDAEEGAAPIAAEGTDDDLSELDEISLSEDDFGFEPSGDVSRLPDENAFTEEDFFTEDDLDLSAEPEAEATAYAHAVRSDDDYRASPAPFSPFGMAHGTAVSAPAPEVETLSVAEEKVEQTHSLDLPEINYGEEENNAGLTDLEAEFAEVFNTVGVDEAAKSDAQSEADRAFEDIFRESASSYLPDSGAGLGAAVGAAALGVGAATAAGVYGRSQATTQAPAQPSGQLGNEDDFYNHWAAQGAQPLEAGDYGERAAMQAEDDLGSAAEAYRNRPVRGRRGLILASVAGVAVLLGGIGYHFIGGSGSGEPVVIRADNQPIKMQPENPGGATVPNQDKAVYDRVAGTLPNNPEQKSLITSGEEPVDISGTDDSENMVDNTPDEQPVANNAPAVNQDSNRNAPLVQPREVETMIVRPDGSIVQPSSAPEETASQMPPANSAQPAAPAGGDEIAALAAGNAPVTPAAQSQTQAQTQAPAPQPQPAAEAPRLPVRAPVVPSRPAEQPVNIVGNVPQRTQAPVAANPAPAPAAPQVASAAGAGGYFIQIASQPSAELAQKSYANMAQKFGSVIGGRSVDIKRADIPGKGTYYRVRVQGGSKEDASALCARLKSAGGSCFVTQ
ncbi:SPOR domain-containing protein [Ochrobactrum sp. LMG 5442]|nr:SPOR domain-containing protein [Ochrobactrum sp. LMG 5442]